MHKANDCYKGGGECGTYSNRFVISLGAVGPNGCTCSRGGGNWFACRLVVVVIGWLAEAIRWSVLWSALGCVVAAARCHEGGGNVVPLDHVARRVCLRRRPRRPHTIICEHFAVAFKQIHRSLGANNSVL